MKHRKRFSKKTSKRESIVKLTFSWKAKAKRINTAYSKRKNWSEGYDLILFNICFGGVTDDAFIKSIVNETAKNGKGAVFLHCSLHTFRNAKDGTVAYRKLMGLSSKNHGKKSPIIVENVNENHPIMIGFPQVWETPNGELYNIFAQGDKVEVLAKGHYADVKATNVCIWTNIYEDSKIFGMSLGHHNETMAAKQYQDILSRGVLWTVGKLKSNGKAVEGYGK